MFSIAFLRTRGILYIQKGRSTTSDTLMTDLEQHKDDIEKAVTWANRIVQGRRRSASDCRHTKMLALIVSDVLEAYRGTKDSGIV
jgi:plasmid replication initiation protein